MRSVERALSFPVRTTLESEKNPLPVNNLGLLAGQRVAGWIAGRFAASLRP
jgi:hypothetical protein